MRYYRNYWFSKSERLTFATLFSLVLHVSLLFLVRFAQPALNDLASVPPVLNVLLEHPQTEQVAPAGIPLAGEQAAGQAKIGVQEKNPAAQGNVATPEPAPGERFSTEIAPRPMHEKILAVEKPQPLQVEKPAESVPELLATKKPEPGIPEQHEEKQASLAPAPNVAKPETPAPPPVEKLVSAELLPGERRDKIVPAEPVQQKPVAEQPAPEKPLNPVEVAKPAAPVIANAPAVEAAKPVQAEAVAAPKAPPAEGSKSQGQHATGPGPATPGQPVLGIPLIKKFAREEDKTPPPAARRKVVSFKERDFRYAMYIEGMRLKLERIGSLNYPAASDGASLAGTLSARISIRADGSLEDFSIIRSSGQEELNAGAEKIVRMSAPFSPLPEDIKREAEVLTVTIKWTFSKSRQLFD